MGSRENPLSNQIIGAAIEVHRALGPGLLENVYQQCLAHEFTLRGLVFEQEKPLPVGYKGVQLDCGYRADFVVEGLVVVELKAVEELRPVHACQVLTYLKVSGCQLGLLMNWNVPVLRDGIRRVVLGLDEEAGTGQK
jgi:GxxExxY protein